MSRHPTVRSGVVHSEQLGDEFVLIHEETRQAHALRPEAAGIWELCDGSRTEDEIAGQLGLGPELVRGVIAEFDQAELLEPSPRISRRAMLGRSVGAGAAGALVLTVALPPAIAFASTSTTATVTKLITITTEYGVSTPTSDATEFAYYYPPITDSVYVDDAGNETINSPPSSVPYVEFSVNPSGDLILELTQYDGAGSASFTATGGTVPSGNLIAGTPIDIGQPTSGSVHISSI